MALDLSRLTPEEQATAIYIGYYNRAADPIGFDFWLDAVNNPDVSLAQIGDLFAPQVETLAAYPFLGNPTAAEADAFVSEVYLNLFNRAPDQAGLDFYSDALEASINGTSTYSIGQIILDIIGGAQDSAAGNDRATILNKIEAALAWTDAANVANIDYQFGSAAEQSAKDVVDTVDDTQASVDQAIAVANAFFNESAVLTANTDILVGNVFEAGLVFTPAGNDRVNSLQDEDELTGAGTNPTLNATLGNANDNGATVITPELNGVETINAGFTGSGFAVTALDLQDATGVDALNITRVSQAINFAEVGNLTSAVSSISVENTNANNNGVVEVSFVGGALAGDDSVDLSIDNVNVFALNVGQNTSGINFGGVSGQGYETIALDTGASSNAVGVFNLPMDTGTAGSIAITGSGALTLGANANIVNAVQTQLPEATVWLANSGIQQTGGRLASLDLSAYTGDTMIVLDNILDIGKAGTSGVAQDVTVTGGEGADMFILMDAVQAAANGGTGDMIDGGNGADTILLMNGANVANTVSNVETARIEIDADLAPVTVTADFDFLPDATGVTLRNVSNNGVLGTDAASNVATFNLVDLSAAQAQNIAIEHATTGARAGASGVATDGLNNGDIALNVINVDLKTDTANDTLGLSIENAFNAGPRFNFTVDNVTAANDFENLTLADNDTESNTVRFNDFATDFTGTMTVTGGQTGQFMNLDMLGNSSTVNGNGDLGGRGVKSIATDGTAVDNFAGNNIGAAAGTSSVAQEGYREAGTNATYQRFGMDVFDASTYVGDVILRVGTDADDPQGGQTITTGAGNDFVVFDDISTTSTTNGTAGLTNADVVDAGAGMDWLVLDGHSRNIVVQQSEWDNVKNFETIYLAGNGAGNQYILQLDNDVIDANGPGDLLNIVNDDQSLVSATTNVDVSTDNTSAVLFLNTLNAQNHITYDGEEGTGSTVDRFVVNDQNTNGQNVIDGGEVNISNNTTVAAASSDTLEVRNSATVTVSDLANIQNVGFVSAINDQALQQTLSLTLNDTVVDAMVDGGHAATNAAGRVEQIVITAGATSDAADGSGSAAIDEAGNAVNPVAASQLVVNAQSLTTKSSLNINADQDFAANDTFNIGLNVGGVLGHTVNGQLGVDTVNVFGAAAGANVAINLGAGAGNYTLASGTVTTANTLTNIENVSLAGVTNAGSVSLIGTDGANVLTGTAGNDFIFGGRNVAGNDTLNGGDGNDSFLLLGNYAAGTYAGTTFNGVDIGSMPTVPVTPLADASIINGGAGTDTLTTFGAINLTGTTLNSIEAINSFSDVTLTQAQFSALTSLTFGGDQPHTLTITGTGTPVDLAKVLDNTTGNINIVVNQADVINAPADNGTGTNTVNNNGGGNNGGGNTGFTTIDLSGQTAVTAQAGVAEAFVLEFNSGSGSALSSDAVVAITGFDPTEDKLVFDDANATPQAPAVFLNGNGGAVVAADPFANSTSVSFQDDNANDAVPAAQLTLLGIQDASLGGATPFFEVV